MTNLFGIVGWSGSGKTDLVCRLINFYNKNSIVVSSIKHTHHKFEVDKKGKDSSRHIQSGSNEVLLYGGKKWAIISKLQKKEVGIEDILNKFQPETKLILVEGLKYGDFPKIEVIRSKLNKPHLFKKDSNIKAIVCDKKIKDLQGLNIPCFSFKETNIIADFIINFLKL